MDPKQELAPLANRRAVLLTTYRKDGTPVGTAVNIAVEDDHAYFRTYDKAGKAKRLRRNPTVEVAPSTLRGQPTGPALHARAELLTGEDAHRAAQLLARKHRLLQGLAVPLMHRLRRYRTLHYRLTPSTG